MNIDVIIPSFDSISGGNIYNQKVFSRLQNQLSLHYTFLDSDDSKQIFNKKFAKAENRILLIDSLYIPSIFKDFPDIFQKNKVIGLIHLPIGMDIDHATPEIKIIEIAAYKACYHLICTSDYIKTQIVSQYKIAANKIDVVRPGVERFKKKADYSESPRRLICVSNLIGRKNLSLIISSCVQLQQKDWILDIFGRMDMDKIETNKIRRQIEALGLSEHIFLKGEMDHITVVDCLNDYDLLLFSSSFETFGMVIAESIQARLPYLTTQVGEFEYFNSFGIGVHANDELSFSSTLIELMSNNKMYGKLVSKAKLLTLDLPHWDDVNYQFRDLLIKL